MIGYVVRGWVQTPAGHPCVTVVDELGKVMHVTIPRRLTTAANVRHVIEYALEDRPPLHPDRR